MTDISMAVMAKRKRGRPRKDSNLCREGGLQSSENSTLMKTQGAESAADATKKECSDDGMVGSMVYGVVEGSFDAGYLISVRIGNNLTPFRGVVFQPRKVVAVTPVNDVAPQAKMYQRREIPVPSSDDNNQNQSQPKQAASVLPYNQSSSFMATDDQSSGKQFPYVHLRMVEEDDVMQAFEVSTSSNLPPNNAGGGRKESKAVELESMAPPPAFQMNAGESGQAINSGDLYYNEGRSQDLDSTSKRPNLQLDLAFTIDKEKQMGEDSSSNIYSSVLNGMKNPIIGYHQALVSGNPLLLPPDIISEPLEFVMETPKTPINCKSNMEEVQSRLGDDASSYKLELASPHTRIADMDFVLSQPTQSNFHGITTITHFPSQNNQS